MIFSKNNTDVTWNQRLFGCNWLLIFKFTNVTRHAFFFLFSGICSFFFFTGKFKMVQDVAPSLNYYWVPILVSILDLKAIPYCPFAIPKFSISRLCFNHISLHLQTVVVGAYLIAHGFFSVYAMCVDTLFLCFCKWWHIFDFTRLYVMNKLSLLWLHYRTRVLINSSCCVRFFYGCWAISFTDVELLLLSSAKHIHSNQTSFLSFNCCSFLQCNGEQQWPPTGFPFIFSIII